MVSDKKPKGPTNFDPSFLRAVSTLYRMAVYKARQAVPSRLFHQQPSPPRRRGMNHSSSDLPQLSAASAPRIPSRCHSAASSNSGAAWEKITAIHGAGPLLPLASLPHPPLRPSLLAPARGGHLNFHILLGLAAALPSRLFLLFAAAVQAHHPVELVQLHPQPLPLPPHVALNLRLQPRRGGYQGAVGQDFEVSRLPEWAQSCQPLAQHRQITQPVCSSTPAPRWPPLTAERRPQRLCSPGSCVYAIGQPVPHSPAPAAPPCCCRRRHYHPPGGQWIARQSPCA